jgi:hypothetical protein
MSTNGPLTSASLMVYSRSTGSPEVAASLSKSSLSSLPTAFELVRTGEGGERLPDVLAVARLGRKGK